MFSKQALRRRSDRRKVGAVALTGLLVAVLMSVVGASPADAAGKLSLGDRVIFSDGSPAAGVKITVFEARNQWRRGQFLGSATTGPDGSYSFEVGGGCYITVTIAPLGSEFDAVGSGKVYNQQYGCVEGAPNNNFDSVLYREDTKPPPTTTPPTTVPPTTVPPTTTPTTAPPTTLPPTTAPPTTLPTTTTAPKPPPDPPETCLYRKRTSAISIYDTEADSFLLYNDADGPAFGVVIRGADNYYYDGPTSYRGNLHQWGPVLELQDPDLTIFGGSVFGTHLHVAAQDDDSKKPSKRIKCVMRSSPIALDVDGSGAVERVNADVEFDFAGNGDGATATEWFAPTEGILFDTRIEGPITGEHLFGDQAGLYADGFEKLALLDTNTDGQVAGAELDGLAIWTDTNTNGVLDAGEQSSLADHGLVSLSTSHTNMVSTAALADGTTMMTEDLWFPTVEAAASSNTTRTVVMLGLAGLGLLGYAMTAGRRRRNGLDAELAQLVEEQQMS